MKKKLIIMGHLFREFGNQKFQCSLHTSCHLKKIAVEECDTDGDHISLLQRPLKRYSVLQAFFRRKKKKNGIWFCINNFINKHQNVTEY